MPRRIRIVVEPEVTDPPEDESSIFCVVPGCDRTENVGLDGNMKCDYHKTMHCTHSTCRRKINGKKACSSHRCTMTNTCYRDFVYERNGIKYCSRHNICSVDGCFILRMSNVDYCYEHTERGCPSIGCP